MRLIARVLGMVTALALLAGLAVGGGFAWFAYRAANPVVSTARADGIVVLTGGPDRIETGLHLLAAGRAPRLLVSGVGGGAELAELASRTGLDLAPLAGRVSLGRVATSTRTNATETADWVQRHQVRSLLVVTAGFHMPRAFVELRRRLAGVELLPAPVPAGVGKAPSLRTLGEEYIKWLAAEAGLSALAPSPDPRGPEPRAPEPRAPEPRAIEPRPANGHAG